MLKSTFHNLSARIPFLGRAYRRIFKGQRIDGLKESIRGKDNALEARGATLSGVEVDIIGDDNRVVFGEGSVVNNLKVRIRGSNHKVEIGMDCRVTRGGTFWMEDDHGELTIGQNTTMVEVSIAVTEPGSRVIIGEDCMFANDIDIRTGDSHSVVEAESGKRINFAENITIGNHVWVAAHTIILKGVNLGENSVVASGAIVTQPCAPGTILGGNPAKAIKTGISWKRERISKESA